MFVLSFFLMVLLTHGCRPVEQTTMTPGPSHNPADGIQLKPIGVVHSPFKRAKGTPIQPRMAMGAELAMEHPVEFLAPFQQPGPEIGHPLSVAGGSFDPHLSSPRFRRLAGRCLRSLVA